MLAVSLSMFALVSAFVAFGSWPGAKSAKNVDQVTLADVAKPSAKRVAVRSDAVIVARRAAQRRAQRVARARTRGIARVPDGTPVAQLPAGSAPLQGAPVTSTGGATQGGTGKAAPTPTTRDVTKDIGDTTQQVGTQVQQQVQNVQTQVNQVVDQVIGPTSDTTSTTVTTVTDSAGSLLGH